MIKKENLTKGMEAKMAKSEYQKVQEEMRAANYSNMTKYIFDIFFKGIPSLSYQIL